MDIESRIFCLNIVLKVRKERSHSNTLDVLFPRLFFLHLYNPNPSPISSLLSLLYPFSFALLLHCPPLSLISLFYLFLSVYLPSCSCSSSHLPSLSMLPFFYFLIFSLLTSKAPFLSYLLFPLFISPASPFTFSSLLSILRPHPSSLPHILLSPRLPSPAPPAVSYSDSDIITLVVTGFICTLWTYTSA